jgi:predicted HTH domain antitoxin
MARTRQLNLRIDAEIAEALEEIAEAQALRKTDVALQYLVAGVRQWRVDQAVRRYRQGLVSVERAAEESGTTLYELMDELRRRARRDLTRGGAPS